MADCVFCKIISGDLPVQKVYDGEKVIAFLDIKPIAWGHVLVVPRDHHATWLDLPKELVTELALESQKIAAAAVKAARADGFNLLMNNDRCAGQAIPHVHFHIVPRKPKDSIKFNWATTDSEAGELELIASAIRGELL